MGLSWKAGLALAAAAPLAAGFLASDGDDFRREGDGDRRERLDPLEGEAPPPLAVTSWMNTGGEALSLDALRGKVVALKFWGTW